MSKPPQGSTPLDHDYAEQIVSKLWDFVRKKAFKEKDLSAAIDILRHYTRTNFIYDAHAQAAAEILGRADVPMPDPPAADAGPAAAPSGPKGLSHPEADPAALIRRLQDAGMLRGRNGQKAVDLLEKSSRWSAAQRDYAADLATNIQKSALVFIAVREMAEAGRGGNFAEAMVEAFEEWGSYTPKQLDASRNMVERDGNGDPLEALERSPNQMQLPRREAPQGPRDDDDIPF